MQKRFRPKGNCRVCDNFLCVVIMSDCVYITRQLGSSFGLQKGLGEVIEKDCSQRTVLTSIVIQIYSLCELTCVQWLCEPTCFRVNDSWPS